MQNLNQHIYVSIDLKSFYASVECIERGLNPIITNLVVADSSMTEKTICLAVSPALKSYGISSRARLFEVVQKVHEINFRRRQLAPNNTFTCTSYDNIALKKNPDLELTYIVAPPRMNLYIKYSKAIYNVYLKWFSPDDIHVYSIDEVFIDITPYLNTYNMEAKKLVTKVIQNVYETTGITATAGIGTNLYLCKIAMDIVAKHVEPNENGVRIAELDEISYRKLLWNHKPITDFWRVGNGYAKKLEKHNIFTMGDIAKVSIDNEDLLYKLFGVNAELLIDHAWGWEPITINQIKSYKPMSNSLSSGQVLHYPYNYEQTKLIIKEMAELLTLELVEKNLVTNQLALTIGYDVENLSNPYIRNLYNGEIAEDRYGRQIPKHSHGTINLDYYTSSTKIIITSFMKLYQKIVSNFLLIRRINIAFNNVVSLKLVKSKDNFKQLDLFTNYQEIASSNKDEMLENKLQKTLIHIKKKYGKNAILKGMNLQIGGTTIERNLKIGGHKG